MASLSSHRRDGFWPPIIRIQNLNDSDAPFNFCDEELPSKFQVQSGDLLSLGPALPVFLVAHIWRGSAAWLNQHIFRVIFDEALSRQTIPSIRNQSKPRRLNRHCTRWCRASSYYQRACLRLSEFRFLPLPSRSGLWRSWRSCWGGWRRPRAAGDGPRPAETLPPIRPRRRLLRPTHRRMARMYSC